MKKVLISFVLLLSMTASVKALSWAYSFVVWKGKVYEVTEEIVGEDDLGRHLGSVKTKPNDVTGSYYGNASNIYAVGTKYFEINGESPNDSIAVEVENNQWVKAIYIHQAPFHWMNLIPKILPVLIVSVIVFVLIFFSKNRRNKFR